MLTQVHRGESAPRVQGQYTSGLKPSQSSGMQGGHHGRNNRYTSNSVNTTNRMVRSLIWLSFFIDGIGFFLLGSIVWQKKFSNPLLRAADRYLRGAMAYLSFLKKLFVDSTLPRLTAFVAFAFCIEPWVAALRLDAAPPQRHGLWSLAQAVRASGSVARALKGTQNTCPRP